ncbi:MAG: CDP-2,3-bis-(O-geranylgeranyl)-sn-glycerol synthase [Candidatus Diapherotrites archaeon]|uniref:CDP-2,3-bis-(O-geranylgeranyl)-sn-glycerol synthase n=1 Tax=Candidatus Iainarchaeum sp. TaxID=3101447 RepID=A0A8T4LEL2_9ARCH|nr:CDP-2,3-bis-(O-geranylgeranyl)-sn-glycerol synthase [Candidatus Diapherotrites archaeon]
MGEALLLQEMAKTILYVLPMYFANSSAMLWRGKTPIDLDVKWVDGKPVFGKGKTVRGTLGGIFTGTMVALLLRQAFPAYTALLAEDYLALGFLLSVGAMAGDIAASFIKRRNDLEVGAPVLFLDQLDFAFGAMIVGSLAYTPGFYEIIVICVATVFVHRLSNWIAFKAKLKHVPW